MFRIYGGFFSQGSECFGTSSAMPSLRVTCFAKEMPWPALLIEAPEDPRELPSPSLSFGVFWDDPGFSTHN